MEFPTQMQIGTRTYRVKMPAREHSRKYASVCYQSCTITLYKHETPAEKRNSFWHEVTHAVLKEMDSELYRDEVFVTKFSTLLSNAIDSARFE